MAGRLPGEPMLIAGATITAADLDRGHLWAGDGIQTLALRPWNLAEAGDIVSFTIQRYSGVDGTIFGENPQSWTKTSGGNPVPAPAVGKSSVDSHVAEAVTSKKSPIECANALDRAGCAHR